MAKQNAAKASSSAVAIRHETLPMVVKARSKVASKSAKSSVEKPKIGRDEIIRQRAYSLYQARGGIGGNALDDWLQAEAQVKQI